MTDPRTIYSERERYRLSSSILNSFKVRNLDDIKIAIHTLSNHATNSTNTISTNVVDSNNQVQVSATVREVSPYSIIYETLLAIKNKQEAAKNIGPNSNLKITSEGFNKVDPLISRYMGAYRSGHLICWDIAEYRYEYDIITNKLSRTTSSGSV